MALLAVSLVAVALALAWRRRHPKPFPAAFSFLLDTPLRDIVLARTELLRRLALEPGMCVLEIGPGSGFYTESIVEAHAAAHMVCLDLQPAMLRRVRQRLGARPPSMVCGSASALPFRGGSFDRILLMSVLGEVPDRARALRECARLLSDDGTVLIAEALPDPDYIRPAVLIREASAAGLTPLEHVGSWASYIQRFGRRPVS